MSAAHTTAVYALLDAVSGLNTHDATVAASPALPYVVLFTDDGLHEATSLNEAPDLLTVRVTVTSAGLTRESVQIASGKAHTALAGVTPSVSSRSCSPIRQVNSRPIEVDEDVTPHVLFAVNEYAFFSVPA